jgi:hypothetical protein
MQLSRLDQKALNDVFTPSMPSSGEGHAPPNSGMGSDLIEIRVTDVASHIRHTGCSASRLHIGSSKLAPIHRCSLSPVAWKGRLHGRPPVQSVRDQDDDTGLKLSTFKATTKHKPALSHHPKIQRQVDFGNVQAKPVRAERLRTDPRCVIGADACCAAPAGHHCGPPMDHDALLRPADRGYSVSAHAG